MKKTIEHTLKDMISFLEAQMNLYARTLDETIGMPLISIDHNEKDGNITAIDASVGYAGPVLIPLKAQTNLIKKLEKRFKQQFGLSASFRFIEVGSPRFISAELQGDITIPEKITPELLMQAYLQLVKPDDIHGALLVNHLLKKYHDLNGVISQSWLIKVFADLLWPDHEECVKKHIQLQQLGPLSLVTVTSHYMYADDKARDIHYRCKAQLAEMKENYPDVVTYANDFRAFKATVGSKSSDEFCDELEHFKAVFGTVIAKLDREISAIQETLLMVNNSGLMMHKLRLVTEFLLQHNIASEFSQMIAPFWTIPIGSEIDLYSKFDYKGYIDFNADVSGMVNVLRKYREFSRLAIKVIDERLVSIAEQHALEKKQRAESKKALKLEVRSRVPAPTVEEVTQDITLMTLPVVTVAQPETATREAKVNALSIETRHESKRAARQQRRMGLFEKQEAASSVQKITTIQLIDIQQGDTHIIDICPTATRPAGADHYQISPYKFVVADKNPCVELPAAMRRLLHTNQGRGFIGEVSPGQTGLKYFKEGFVVIKAAEEERVLCAIKTLHSKGLGQDIDLIIPALSVKNHEDYEKMLQRPNMAARLRRLVDDRLLLEESLELVEEGVPLHAEHAKLGGL